MITNSAKRKLIITGFTLSFVVAYFFLGDLILQRIFIEDYCYYETHDTPLYINLLFDFPEYEGYHPVATKMGYLTFGAIGFGLGRLIAKKEGKN